MQLSEIRKVLFARHNTWMANVELAKWKSFRQSHYSIKHTWQTNTHNTHPSPINYSTYITMKCTTEEATDSKKVFALWRCQVYQKYNVTWGLFVEVEQHKDETLPLPRFWTGTDKGYVAPSMIVNPSGQVDMVLCLFLKQTHKNTFISNESVGQQL